MDVKMINPFIDAIMKVIPQLGFQNIIKGKLSVGEQFVERKGVTIIVGLTKDLRGNGAYNMSKETAMKMASTMMMGMPVVDLDDLVQSTICELTNMVTGNAATNFASMGLNVDISPPSFIVGEKFKTKVSNKIFLIIEVMVDSMPIEINIGLG